MRKRPKQYLTNLFKHAGMGAIILTAFYLTGFWFTQFAYNSQASQEKVTVNFAPQSNSGSPAYKVGEIKVVNLILKPKNTDKDISGFKITMMKEGKLDIVGIRDPSIYPNTGTTGSEDITFTPVVTRPHTVTYVITIAKNKSLPHAVRIPVEIQGTAKGDGKLLLNKSQSSVVGNIAGSKYEFDQVEEGNYKFK